MNTVSQTHHCTQFMLDFVPRPDRIELNSFQDYMKREGNYDLTFCNAWVNHINTKIIDDAQKLFDLFMSIQKTAMHHIELIGKMSDGGQYRSGIAIGQSYSVTNTLVSDFEGIKELVSQIWFDKKETFITVYSEKNSAGFHSTMYLIYKEAFCKRTPQIDRTELLFKNDSSKESFETILKTIQPYYDVGMLKGGVNPLRIQSTYKTQESKKAKTVDLFNSYLTTIKNLNSNEEKILKICDLCRELEQLHLFDDGNGRSVFILANLLAGWNNLTPFYPKNMCVFDANSLKTMVQEFIEGQERFTLFFGSKEQFTKNLTEYKITVEQLTKLSKEKFSKFDTLMTSIKERNFNLLLRQTAPSKDTKELLEFLLNHLSHLNIDRHSKGKTSGTALDIAIKNKNEEAIALLSQNNF